MRQCCVPGCKLENQPIHRFPFDSNLGQLWVQAVGNESLKNMSYDLIRQKGIIVCGLHFTESSYQPQSSRHLLKAYAVPTLRLPSKQTDCLEKNTGSNEISNLESTRRREPRERSPPITEERRMKINESISSYLRLKDQISSKKKIPVRHLHSKQSVSLPVPSTSQTEKEIPQKNLENKIISKRQREDDVHSSKVTILEKRKKIDKIDSSSDIPEANFLVSDVNASLRIQSSECLQEEIVIVDEHLTVSSEPTNGELSPVVMPIDDAKQDKSNRRFELPNPACSINISEKETPHTNSGGKILKPRKACNTKTSRFILAKSIKRNSLTPKAKQIFREAKEIRKCFYAAKRKVKRLEKKLEGTRKYIRVVERMENLCKAQRIFVEMQLKNVDVSAQGRRFSDEEKVLALSIFKKSPAAYKHLTNLFTLPSKPVLMKFLSTVPLDTGINTSVVDHLKEIAEKSNKVNKQLSMCWDEAHIHPHVAYDMKKDKIIGFEDSGSHRSAQFADRVMVFMLRRLSDGAKIPFSYYYTHSQMKYGQLIQRIRENIRAVASTGFELVVTICDQGSSNLKAIDELRNEYIKVCKRKDVEPGSEVEMTVEGVTFIAVLDIPHIIKGIRNNLLKKPLNLGDGKLVKWVHYKTAFELDTMVDKPVLSLPKLKEGHIYEEKMPKMKVCVAAQVFSRSMANFIYMTCQYNAEIQTRIGALKMPTEAAASASFANLMDTTFDSMNGISEKKNFEKPMKNVVTKDSGHVDYWIKTRSEFEKMFFVNDCNQRLTPPPSLKSIIWNLKAMPQLWKNLQNADFLEFKPGYVNQDLLENFFGMLRSHSHRFVNLTCLQVDGLFKTLLLNNLTSRHSLSANCLNDGTDALESLGNFLMSAKYEVPTRVPGPDAYYQEKELNDTTRRRPPNRLGNVAWLRYAGNFLLKCRRKITCLRECQECEKTFYSRMSRGNELAAIKEPSREGPRRMASEDYFERGFVAGMSIVRRKLNVIAFQSELRQKLASFVSRRIEFEWIKCTEHKEEVKEKFLNLLITENILHWCNHINRLLAGTQKEHGGSILEQRAVNMHNVSRRSKAAIDKIKRLQFQRSQSSRGTNTQNSG